MWVNENAVVNKKPNFKKLIEYGFENRGEYYFFSVDIINGMFRYNIYVTNNGLTKLEVIDKTNNEEYILVCNEGAVGSFVAGVRTECEEILNDIVKKCYDTDLFKSDYAKRIAEYVNNKYGIKPEYLWAKTPNNCIFRDNKTKRWFIVFLLLEKRKLGIDSQSEVEIINLKEKPENVQMLVDGKKYFAGYHMNKKHWYTICLDGSVSIEEIYEHIDKSYYLIKKEQKEYKYGNNNPKS